VHALVCNAAASTAFGPLLSTTEDQFVKMLHTNVVSAFLTVREFAGRGAFAHGASIVFVSSIGAYVPLPALGAYSVTKTALLALTRALAAEMGASEASCSNGDISCGRVRVNAVAPGIIKTKFSERLWKPLEGEPDGGVEKMPFNVPLGRLGLPSDISGVVSFLVSDDAAYITGETVVASGGLYARL
jgi:dehydrogenase/reductase SDR family member 4